MGVDDTLHLWFDLRGEISVVAFTAWEIARRRRSCGISYRYGRAVPIGIEPVSRAHTLARPADCALVVDQPPHHAIGARRPLQNIEDAPGWNAAHGLIFRVQFNGFWQQVHHVGVAWGHIALHPPLYPRGQQPITRT